MCSRFLHRTYFTAYNRRSLPDRAVDIFDLPNITVSIPSSTELPLNHILPISPDGKRRISIFNIYKLTG